MEAIISLAAMQISWFACVLGAANEMPWLGVVVSICVVAQHLMRAQDRVLEIKLIAAAFVFGLVLDSALATAGLMTFESGTLVSGWTTPWMLALWIGFATALTSTLSWVVARPAASIAFGAIGGPLAYWSGAKLGAITLNAFTLSLTCIGFGWAAAMGAFSFLTRRLKASVSSELYV